jgi:DNA modification methylase
MRRAESLTNSGQDECTGSASEEVPQGNHTEFVGGIPPEYDVMDGAEVLIVSRDQSYLTHGIHSFPAKFFPELPRYLILKFSKPREAVLDPMCGSGTVVLESVLNRRIGLGVDIDSMALLISRAKTTPIRPSLLDSSYTALSRRIAASMEDAQFRSSIPQFPYRDKWFKPHVLQELALVRNCILTLPEYDDGFEPESWPSLLRFLQVVMSSIIRGVSNADPHCTRTVIRKNLVKDIRPGDATSAFLDALSKQCQAMKELWGVYETRDDWDATVLHADATETSLADDSVSLAVTSPPYINAVDYPRTHQLEMYWLGHLGEGPLSEVKRNYIGTETVYKNEYSEMKRSGLSSLDPLLERIYHTDPRRSYIVFRFFQEMEDQLGETWRVLKPGGRYCIAIGNNVIRGVLVESHKILAEIAQERIGFELERMFFSKIIRHFIRIPRRERMLGEWVLILRKPGL